MSKKNNNKDGNGAVPDAALWAVVTRDVKPLKRTELLSTPIPEIKPPLKKTDRSVHNAPEIKPPPPTTKAHPSAGLDTRTLEKLRKGQIPIEGRLDLHGLSQARAHAALNRFIAVAFAEGKRCILVITGKGAGVLSTAVPEWLADEPLRTAVLKVQTAQPRHGGGGAVYVYLRRQHL